MCKLVRLKSIEGFKLIKEKQEIGSLIKVISSGKEGWVITRKGGSTSEHETLSEAKLVANRL